MVQYQYDICSCEKQCFGQDDENKCCDSVNLLFKGVFYNLLRRQLPLPLQKMITSQALTIGGTCKSCAIIRITA